MKKLFTFAMALMAAMAINATDYYFAGAANGWFEYNGWAPNDATWKFVDVDGVLTLEVADLYGEFKVTENGAWHPQHGAAAAGEGVALGGTYNLVKCDDSEGEKDAPANCKILIPNEGDWRYKNAKLELDATDPDHLIISLVSGTLYDHSAAPKTYQIVGAFNGWDNNGAPSFEEINGVLTVTVADLSGTFKIIQDHAWDNQWATNWETGGGLALGEPYILGAKGDQGEPDNLSLANPFGGYKDAVLTLTKSGDDFVLTLVSGTFNKMQTDWFVPGSWQGATWACNDAAKMTPVDGQANTYELLLAEFAGEFKVVYGQWAVEFGAPKGESGYWTVNTPLELSFPCDNMKPEDPEAVYQDVTITLVVDYDNVAATLTIATEGSAVQTIQLNAKSIKRIENGQVIIENNGVRFNAAGIAQ